MKNDNIILIGMMGAGKTSVGKALKSKLPKFQFVDVDSLIEKDADMVIADIFSKHSEDYFRDIETKAVKKICRNSHQIISTGGGTFQNEENRKVLLNSGKVFYLYAPSHILYDRIKEQITRPLLMCENPLKKLEELLKERDINYKKADYIINTAFLNLDKVTNEILRRTNEAFDFS